MTIQSPEIIQQIIDNNGALPGNPPATAIYRYQTPEDKTVYGICLSHQDVVRLLTSPYCLNPFLIWTQ